MVHTLRAKISLEKIQFYLISLFVLTLPYKVSNGWIGTLTILIFLIPLYQKKISMKVIIKEKLFLALFSFILLTYISILWSDIGIVFNSDYRAKFNNFNYYFIIIVGIYFSSVTKKDLHLFIKLLAFSPILYILIYYLSSFSIASIYSLHYTPNGYRFFQVDLIANIFLVFSAYYFLLHALDRIKKRSYKASFFNFILFLVVSSALFIDEKTNARIVNILYFFSILIPVVLYFRTNIKLLSILFILIFSLSSFFIITDKDNQRGYQEFLNCIEKEQYTGSWGYRVGLIIVSYKIFQEKPIFGYSINNMTPILIQMKKEMPKYFAGSHLKHPHNQHMNILIQTGIVGYSFFLFFLFQLFRLKLYNREFCAFKYLLFFSITILSFGEDYFNFQSYSVLVATLIAFFLRYKKLENNKNKMEF